MNLTPLGDRVIVKPKAPEEKPKAVSFYLIQLRKSLWKAK